VDVNVFDTQSDLPICAESVTQIAQSIVALENQAYDEVGIYFVPEGEICRLHNLYFNDPSPTDCISFPMDTSLDEGYRVLGEIFICPSMAIHYTQHSQKSPHHELTLYIVHGLLHLMGYDDIKEKDRRLMRAAERKYMLHLQATNRILSEPRHFSGPKRMF
jgi:probable rRNA maturation factor